MGGATAMVNFSSPENIGGVKQTGEKMGWIDLNEVTGNTLRRVLPHVGLMPNVAADEFASMGSGGVGETADFDLATLLDGLPFSPLSTLFWIGLKFAADPHESHDSLSVFTFSAIGGAGEAVVGEENEVIAGAVAPRFGARGTACSDFAGWMMPDLFEHRRVEWHFLRNVVGWVSFRHS
jgi:hypothetical protein